MMVSLDTGIARNVCFGSDSDLPKFRSCELVLVAAGRSGAVLKRDVWRTEGINSHFCRPEIRGDGPHIPLDFGAQQSVCVAIK
jgi:hypothetical protein